MLTNAAGGTIAPGPPQEMAVTWILKDDPSRPDPCDKVDILLTRFGLATFSPPPGEGWDRKDGWLVEEEVCDWVWYFD